MTATEGTEAPGTKTAGNWRVVHVPNILRQTLPLMINGGSFRALSIGQLFSVVLTIQDHRLS